MKNWLAISGFLLVFGGHHPAFGWGSEGHQLVGSVADKLLVGHPAKKKVEEILGFELRVAAPWPDCVRSVVRNDDNTFTYSPDPHHPEYTTACHSFETPAEKARMEDYVGRNWSNCKYIPGHGCHETYHFADVPIQRGRYVLGYAGTNNHDIVSAINAAVAVLKNQQPSDKLSIKDQKEALFLLAHFLGDLHQPLHVGSVYLDEHGTRLNPASPEEVKEETETSGGNFLYDGQHKLHSAWDAIPDSFGTNADKAMVAKAKTVRPTSGQIGDWAATWATDTILASRKAFSGLTFTKAGARHWDVRFKNRKQYWAAADKLKREQIAKGGAHLAELLKAIWPN